MALLPARMASGPVELQRWQLGAIDELEAAIAASFAELHRWMQWANVVPTAHELRLVLDRFNAEFDDDRAWQYLLYEVDGGQLVGGAGLVRLAVPSELGVGYWVRSDRTGRGYATASARALTNAAFTYVPDVRHVEIHMDQANLASAAVPRKLGFRLDREVDREIQSPGHTGRGFVWTTEGPVSDTPFG